MNDNITIKVLKNQEAAVEAPKQELTIFGIPITHGGAGSGNFGHSGRPGEIGGSGGGGGGGSSVDNAPDGTSATFSPEKGGTLFHGTRMPDDFKYIKADRDKVVYLTDSFGEAKEYAQGAHLGGGKGGGTQRVIRVKAMPGKMVNIDKDVADAIENGDDLGPIFAKARKAGALYAEYNHPTNIEGKIKEQRVIVSLREDNLGRANEGWDAEGKFWTQK